MVKKIRIKNFKSLEDVEIDISQLNFLFGANSSGKSSFLKALMFLEKNLFPINNGRSNFKVGQAVDLGDFHDIVSNNDNSKIISYAFSIEGQFSFPRFSVIFDQNASDNPLREHYFKDELPNTSFFELFRRIREDEMLADDEYLAKTDCKAELIIEFKYAQSGKYLSRILLNDLVSKSIAILTFGQQADTSDYDFPNLELHFMQNVGLTTLFNSHLNSGMMIGVSKKTSLYDEHILNNHITINDLLSESFNEDILWTYRDKIRKEKSSPYIWPEWSGLGTEEKARYFYEIMKFLYLSNYVVPMNVNVLLMQMHLPTVRETPAKKFIVNNSEFDRNDYYGFLNILKECTDRDKEIPKSKHSIAPNHLTVTNKLLKKLMPQYKVSFEYNSDVGSLILYDGVSRVNFNSANSGLLQLFPILMSMSLCFVKKKPENYFGNIGDYFNPEPFKSFAKHDTGHEISLLTLLLEQPELHLHPKLQSNFAQIISDLLREYGSIPGYLFIETHSEHLIRKIQVLIAKGELEREKVGVWYFKKVDGVTKVEKMEIDENGLFKKDWPDGFFDDSVDLTMELFEAIRKRKN